MFKPIQRFITAIILLIGLGGCYPQTLATTETKVVLPVAGQYQVIWDRLPKSSPENLLGIIFHVKKLQQGNYSLEYKHRRKRERKTLETLNVGDDFYIQLQDGDAFELMRVVFIGDEVEIYSELHGCSIKNGDDKDSEINMIRLDTRNCVPALGVSSAEMEIVDGVGRILLREGATAAVEFLQQYGSKMYAEKKYRLKAQ